MQKKKDNFLQKSYIIFREKILEKKTEYTEKYFHF